MSDLPLQLAPPLDARVARKTKLKSFRDIFPQVSIAHTAFDCTNCLWAQALLFFKQNKKVRNKLSFGIARPWMRKLFSPCAAWPKMDGDWPLEEILALPFSFPPSFYLERESRAQSGRGRRRGKRGSRNTHAQKARRIHIGTVSEHS